MLMSKNMRLETQSHIGTIRDSRSLWNNLSAWAPDGTKVLTRAPMFGKPLPFTNDTSSSSKEVLCR
jgi:hypothetical protein